MCAQSSRLSPVDAAWYQMEHPTNLMMVTGVMMLRGPLDVARMRETFRLRFLQFRRFKQRVVPSPLGVGLPTWQDDPYFNLDAHIRHIALPNGNDHAAFMKLLSQLASTPLDYSKPLWQMHLIDNVILEDGTPGSALIMRVHHCIGDGTALVAVAMRLTNTDPDAPIEPEPLPRRAPAPSLLANVAGSATRLLQEGRNLVNYALQEGVESIGNPGRVLELGQGALDIASEGAAMLSRALLKPADPLTPLKGALGVAKRATWSKPVTVAETKAICTALGCKVNDVLIAALTGALRTYLHSRDTATENLEISAVVPVDIRRTGTEFDLGNAFGLVFLALPVGVIDPLLRLAAVKQRMDELKQSNEAAFYFGMLSLFGFTPRQVEDLAVTFFGTKATAIVTNVMGPRETIYIAGQEVDQMMFWVPQSGRLALGISIYSYNGKILLGIMSDARIIPDPEAIVESFIDEFALLSRLAQAHSAAVQAADAAATLPPLTRAQPSSSQGLPQPLPAAGSRVVCVALTKNGSPCRNLAIAGSAYCHIHSRA